MTSTLTTKMKRILGLNRSIQAPTETDWNLVTKIQALASQLEALTDRAFKDSAGNLSDTLSQQSQDASLVNAIAHVREAVRRVTGKCYFRVQILAGLKLSQGCVAEMATGEGKTLTSAIAGFVHSLQYENIHVATPNSYLAQRDFEELKPVYELLGLKTALLPEEPDGGKTRIAYQSQITYGAGYAFGFDFLRDELVRRQQPQPGLGQETLQTMRGMQRSHAVSLQRGHWCSLIDEIDSVLLDEAMTPLILSVAKKQSAADQHLFQLARRVADRLQGDQDFHIGTTHGKPALTSSGIAAAERALGHPASAGGLDLISGDVMRQQLKRPWLTYVENALQAKYLMRPDVDYIIRDGAILIVDQKTGRIFGDRSWRGGLHQAVEAKEGLKLSDEKSSAGRVTRQSYYQLYSSLCGMTGTAAGAEPEFLNIYGLPTVQIPLNRPSKRQELPDRYFASLEAKYSAIIHEAAMQHRSGQPVLIGTRTIDDSERLSEMLRSLGIEHVVLNGKQDLEEAEIVAAAGQTGRVTVATNMAGRGTDIKTSEAAMKVGGLYVIGVERHESRRIDRQLAGRSARAGAPGAFRFFNSADDSLIAHHAPRLAADWKRRADASGEVQRRYDSQIEQTQADCERSAFHTRMLMMQQDREMHDLMTALCYKGK